MLDIRFIRENPDLVKAAMRKRNANMDTYIDEVLQLDADRREITAKVEKMKSKQNAVTKKIPEMKKNGEDTSEVMREMKDLSDEISLVNSNLNQIEKNCERKFWRFQIFRMKWFLWGQMIQIM